MGSFLLLPSYWHFLYRNILLPTYEQEFNIEGPTLQMLGREDLLGGVSREHLEAALCVLDIESQDELDY